MAESKVEPDSVKPEDDGGRPERPSRRPKYNKVNQQELPTCKPVLEPKWVMLTLFSTALLLLPIGAILLGFGLVPVEIVVRYDVSCIPDATSNQERVRYLWENVNDTSALQCTLDIDVPDDMPGPVYIYYGIVGFYQNHRRYVKSVQDLQLVGESGDTVSTASCAPLEFWAGDQNRTINPCGLVAWTYFNDTYSVQVERGGGAQEVEVSTQDISFRADREHRYGDYEPQNYNADLSRWRGGGQIEGTPKEDERFQNWMRISAMPDFRKLWGRMDVSFKKGDKLSVVVDNRYNTYTFNGQKYLIISNTSWLGGRSNFLGIAYLVVGGTCFVMGIAYYLLRLKYPRRLGDVSSMDEFN